VDYRNEYITWNNPEKNFSDNARHSMILEGGYQWDHAESDKIHQEKEERRESKEKKERKMG
jgi:hypothetical protein